MTWEFIYLPAYLTEYPGSRIFGCVTGHICAEHVLTIKTNAC